MESVKLTTLRTHYTSSCLGVRSCDLSHAAVCIVFAYSVFFFFLCASVCLCVKVNSDRRRRRTSL